VHSCELQSILKSVFELFFSVDATLPDQRMGRLVNDSCMANCKMRKVVINEKPYLALFASSDIEVGTELQYDYGCQDAWWRKVRNLTESVI
jgi:hypothetical protein